MASVLIRMRQRRCTAESGVRTSPKAYKIFCALSACTILVLQKKRHTCAEIYGIRSCKLVNCSLSGTCASKGIRPIPNLVRSITLLHTEILLDFLSDFELFKTF